MNLFKTLITSLLLGSIYTASGQTVTFYFVAPTATINANFGGGQANDMPTGYSFVQITGANAATFQAQASTQIKYVYNQLQPGTLLRTQVNRVFNNSGRMVDVDYFLVDDRTGFIGSGGMFVPYQDGGHTYVWPAANNQPSSGNRFNGWVMLGEHQLDADQSKRVGGIHAVDEVVLHETSHTQFTGNWTKWPAVSGMVITYGSDNNHYTTELLGDQEGALNEGLATYYGFTINQDGMNDLLHDFNQTGYRYFVEGRSVMAGQPALYSVAARRRDVLRDYTGQPMHYSDGGEMTTFNYRWTDVPGWYLLFGESTSTAFFSLYWQQAYSNRDTAFSFIGFAANAMHTDRRKRFLTFACNRLALKMEAYNSSAAGQADSTKTSSMFPFALLDLVTHFGMTDAEYRDDYNRNYPDAAPRAFTEYFNRRNAIRQLVQGDMAATPIRFEAAVQKIRDYCRQPNTIF